MALLAIGAACVASIFFSIAAPRATSLYAHLEHARATLPVVVRFALSRSPGWLLPAGGALLLIAAALPRRRALGRLLLVTAIAVPLVATAVGVAGLWEASRTCGFRASLGLDRCACSTAPGALECHCGEDGALQEVFWAGEDLEARPVGDRLFFGGPGRPLSAPIADLVVRQVVEQDDRRQGRGELYSIEGLEEPTARCRYRAPCDRPRLGGCGPCSFPAADARPEYAIGDDLRCVDAVSGQRRIFDSDFVHLRRTVWEDTSGGTTIPSVLDEEAAIPAETAEIIGSLSGATSPFLEIIGGAGRAPRMRLGGTRICRTTASAAGPLAEGLERELPGATVLLIRLEALEED